ncbi:hypothetical protein AZI86_00745 [Bdellovibrio bacteriovorus]|uniref:Uncharacterized protein n=1 Tax=Bdellovibrio bacteriovorus TaxID=959 RepID=A0A150WMX4_BDEBC|nr:hypothetical protein [Bdellovibrio bacteriovorus]KYG65639.1 hypothetical protein AZI86_00745 [Bdellovibrio bacteriovorus]
MHSAKILRNVICLIVMMPGGAFAAKVDVYKEFESRVSALEKKLPKEKDIVKRYDIFLKTFKEIHELRKKNPRQDEEKEINMSYFMDALAALPGKAEFKAANCSEYVKEVEASAKSYEADHKEDYADRALKVTKLICNK